MNFGQPDILDQSMLIVLSSSPHHIYALAKVAAVVFTALLTSAAHFCTLRMQENSLYSLLMTKDTYYQPRATF